jgi:hypothetical protein
VLDSRIVLRRFASLLGTGLALLALTVVLLEIALRAANALGIATPAERATEPISFYRDEHPAFGVWHPPHAEYHAEADCFDVVYTSNSHGARDVERTVRSAAPRAVVLGDSFVEGIGVQLGLRMTDLLEQWTGVEHLNFGTAGNFSSTQEWKLYETLASGFDHDWVLLFTFPNNDFLENDPQRFWQRDRYRPYLRRADGGFELFYPVGLEEAKRRAADQLWWNRWYNAIFVYRLIAFFDAQVRVRLAQGANGPHGYIGYEQFTDEDLERLFHAYLRIRDLAGGRELLIFTIPRLNDLLYFRDRGYPDQLPKRLAEFAARETGIRYLDLMPGFIADWRAEGRELADYFLPCDGHWSELGNRVAARIVLDAIAPLYTGKRRDPGRAAPQASGTTP